MTKATTKAPKIAVPVSKLKEAKAPVAKAISISASIEGLRAMQPAGGANRVVWTKVQLAQLTKFLDDCFAEGITIGTMLTNYTAFVQPHFKDKSRGAFVLKARAVVKAQRDAIKAEAEAEAEVEEAIAAEEAAAEANA